MNSGEVDFMTKSRIYEQLKRDHENHRIRFAQIEKAGEDADLRRSLFEKLRKELQAHAAAEEESLYATMLKRPDLRDDARHSVSEHKEIDDRLGELIDAEEDSEAWTTQFEGLRKRYFHHIEEEEREIFPAAGKALSDETERRLALRFEERKPRELEAAERERPGDERD